ncbi:zinc-ribbon domain-containing protein [Sphingomicrobium arenosum]|uniref:zinc-ribbon domain-containing protein n=1 Tax=Sphingomicrobium arenosum TaxID=2233861 RepID=UPI002240EFC3|nr:zinc-ribbon domain-containing protein [Sphingomicrobium arenosum]
MILTCPACATRYNIKPGAIPPEGRTVRCANCGHKWHADPDPAPEAAEAPEAAPPVAAPPPPEPAPPAEPVASEPAPPAMPEAEDIPPPPPPPEPEHDAEPEPATDEPAFEADDIDPEVVAEAEEQAAHQEEAIAEEQVADPFDHDTQVHDIGFTGIEEEDEPEARRRWWPWLLLLALIAAAVAGAALFAPPQWKDQLGLAEAGPASDSPLELLLTSQSRTKLPSGNELLTFGGRVVNSSAEAQDVPPIRAELIDDAGSVVYSWTIARPADRLAPGESASFNSAEADIPEAARDLSLTFAD